MIRKICFMLPLLTLVTQCGSYEEVKVKNYRVQIIEADASRQAILEDMVSEFNHRSDIAPLQLVASNPTVTVALADLSANEDGDGHRNLGYGQWKTESKDTGHLTGNRKRVIHYSGAVTLDQKYVEDRAMARPNSLPWNELFVLFSHEFGHVFQMGHDPRKQSVMYEFVGADREILYSEYFEGVRAFMNDQ